MVRMRLCARAAVTESTRWCVSISSCLADRERRCSCCCTHGALIQSVNPLTASLNEAAIENVHNSKHSDILPSRPVSSDGQKDCDRERVSRSNEKSDECYTRNLQSIWITYSAHRVVCMWRQQWYEDEVIGSSLSLLLRPCA